MAKKKARGKRGFNQSKAIRELIDEGIRETGDIQKEMMTRHGVEAKHGLIGNVKTNYVGKKKTAKKATTKRTKAKKARGRAPRAAAAGSPDSLNAAVDFVKAAGGLEQARSALKRIEEIKKL